MPCFTSFSTVLVPYQSALPRVLNQCSMRWRIWAGQEVLVHTRKSFSQIRGMEQTGQIAGRDRVSDPVITASSLGITSPLRITSMRAPLPTWRFFSNPALWAVTRLMVAPDREMGSTRRTGVTLPVRPTCQRMSRTRVSAVSPLSLTAICQR